MTQPDVDLKDRIIEELGAFPRESLAEVLHFVEFLKTKLRSEQIELACASEPVLTRDWLTPEEDEAWKDL